LSIHFIHGLNHRFRRARKLHADRMSGRTYRHPRLLEERRVCRTLNEVFHDRGRLPSIRSNRNGTENSYAPNGVIKSESSITRRTAFDLRI
jgi:hypothetical protein